MADHTMGAAVFSTLETGALYAPLDLNVRYIRPALINSGDLTAHAEVRHGRRLPVTASETTNGKGKTVAMATSSALVEPDGARALVADRSPDEIVGDND